MITSQFFRRRPPYTKQVIECLNNKKIQTNEIIIFIGKFAWKKANAFLKTRPVIALPDDQSNPQDYFWGFVKGLQILAFDTSGVGSEAIRRLAYELLKAGAIVVRVVLISYKLVVFRQGGNV